MVLGPGCNYGYAADEAAQRSAEIVLAYRHHYSGDCVRASGNAKPGIEMLLRLLLLVLVDQLLHSIGRAAMTIRIIALQVLKHLIVKRLISRFPVG